MNKKNSLNHLKAMLVVVWRLIKYIFSPKGFLYEIVGVTIMLNLFQIATVQSGSMSNTIRTGDMVVVSKWHYGPRLPLTLFQFPFFSSGGKVYFFGFKSYISYPQLPYRRFFGFSKWKRNDVFVFNNVGDRAGEENLPLDQRTTYVKRLVGLPGDCLAINEGDLYINGMLYYNEKQHPHMRYRYKIVMQGILTKSVCRRYGIKVEDRKSKRGIYYVLMSPVHVHFFSSLPNVESVTRDLDHAVHPSYFSGRMGGGIDHMSEIIIPKKGMEIDVHKNNLLIYGDVIQKYEGHRTVVLNEEKGELVIDGKQIERYRFRGNYFFAMGDNAYNSSDSRAWGLVPEQAIVGKALFRICGKKDKDSWLVASILMGEMTSYLPSWIR